MADIAFVDPRGTLNYRLSGSTGITIQQGPDMRSDLVFSYKPTVGKLLLSIAFFGLLAIFMALEAINNRAGLILQGFIHFQPDEATTFYWVMAGLAGFFMLSGLIGIWTAMTSRSGPVLRPAERVVPPTALRRSQLTIPYADIRAVQHGAVNRQQYLVMTRRSGRSANLGAAMFQSEQHFVHAWAELAAQVQAARRSACDKYR